MAQQLSEFQKKLLNVVQRPLPICRRPFIEIAELLNCSEQKIIDEIRLFKIEGLIKRFRPALSYSALGRVSSLVTAHVTIKQLMTVSAVINALPGVSHNYLRDHYYNLWFTIQADNFQWIDELLSNLSRLLCNDFHSLPIIKQFKLDVRFDAIDFEPLDIEAVETTDSSDTKPTDLNNRQKELLVKMQRELDIVTYPFDYLANKDDNIDEIIEVIKQLNNQGVIRKITAVVDYERLGFTTNIMFCCKVTDDKIDNAGADLATYKCISHCYHRKTFKDFGFNLFAMVHTKTFDQAQAVIDKFILEHDINDYEMLATIEELKKQPVKQIF